MILPKIPIPEEYKTVFAVTGRINVANDEYKVQIDTSDSDIAYFRIVCETTEKDDVCIQLYHPEYYKDSRKLDNDEKEELIKFLNGTDPLFGKETNYRVLTNIWDGMNNDYSSYPEEDNFWELDMPDYNLL